MSGEACLTVAADKHIWRLSLQIFRRQTPERQSLSAHRAASRISLASCECSKTVSQLPKISSRRIKNGSQLIKTASRSAKNDSLNSRFFPTRCIPTPASPFLSPPRTLREFPDIKTSGRGSAGPKAAAAKLRRDQRQGCDIDDLQIVRSKTRL